MKIEIDAIRLLANQHNVPTEVVVTAVADALNIAYASTDTAVADAHIDIAPDGEVVLVHPDGSAEEPTGFGRIAVATARQAVISWVRDQQRRSVVGVWADREGKVLDAVVVGEGRHGELRLSVDGTNAAMPVGEQVPGEHLNAGDEVRVLLLAANVDNRDNTRLTVSRRQPALVSAMIAESSPEVRSGKVTITSVAREPGVRTKIALAGPDAVASVVGAGGHRLRPVVQALHGEKVDLVLADDDVAAFAAAALTPAAAAGAVVTDEARRHVTVRVPVAQLELATGAGGLNVRLAQRLTRTKIQIVPVD